MRNVLPFTQPHQPANILLHEGQRLIAEFGIALAVSAAGGGRLTETGLSLGTPHCMSPEQATGDRFGIFAAPLELGAYNEHVFEEWLGE